MQAHGTRHDVRHIQYVKGIDPARSFEITLHGDPHVLAVGADAVGKDGPFEHRKREARDLGHEVDDLPFLAAQSRDQPLGLLGDRTGKSHHAAAGEQRSNRPALQAPAPPFRAQQPFRQPGGQNAALHWVLSRSSRRSPAIRA